jgi:hypothetical protein
VLPIVRLKLSWKGSQQELLVAQSDRDT